MPELPDVEHERRFLAEHAFGRTVGRVLVADARIARNATPSSVDRGLRGHRFEDPDRHGKWLIAWTTGPAVLVHFGMTGKLVWGDGPEGRHRHDRVIFELDRGELRYRNMRMLGGMWLAHGQEEVKTILADLGPDVLGLTKRHLVELLGARRAQAKPALMDQGLVAGLGNLLVDESLWRARIHPTRRLDELSDEQRDGLAQAVRHVSRTSVERYDDVPSLRGWLTHVRGLPGALCPRCRTPLDRTVVGGRTTYSCPSCQPAP